MKDLVERIKSETCIEDECGQSIATSSDYWCSYHHGMWRYRGTSKEPKDPLPPDKWLEKENCCGICGKPPGKKRLAVDHDHGCCPGPGSCGGCVRGLLCPACNTLLGRLEAGIVPLAVKYLERYKKRISGALL